MKKVVFGSALIIGGILLAMLSVLVISDHPDGGFILAFPFIGLILFIAGCALGLQGIREDETPASGQDEKV